MYVVEPLPGDQATWRRVAIELPASVTVRMTDDTVKNFGAKYDEAQATVTLTAGKKPPHPV